MPGGGAAWHPADRLSLCEHPLCDHRLRADGLRRDALFILRGTEAAGLHRLRRGAGAAVPGGAGQHRRAHDPLRAAPEHDHRRTFVPAVGALCDCDFQDPRRFQ